MTPRFSPFLVSHLHRVTGFWNRQAGTTAYRSYDGDDEANAGSTSPGLSRRALLATSLTAATLTSGCGSATRSASHGAPRALEGRVPFFGAQQAGISTPPQQFLQLASFDFAGQRLETFGELLRAWSTSAASMVAGRRALTTSGVATDTGEAQELGPSRLTVTLGLGRGLFERNGEDALGLRHRIPPALRPLPEFPTDALQASHSGGDLALQICADDPQVALYALHTLVRIAHGAATMRWTLAGFRPGGPATPRNTLGFKDGTRNLDVTDRRQTAQHLWVGRMDGPDWMAGGTYMVARRVRTLLDVWDATTVEGQEAAIGRNKATGAPLSGRREHDTPDFNAVREGEPLISGDAHISLAAPEHNGGIRVLRRSYNYNNGTDASTGQLDVGLAFLCFQRDPHAQFATLQRKLAAGDALSHHLLHTGSALFACPPGCQQGGFLGAGLLT